MRSDHFEIRQARAADTSGILECLAEAFEPYRTSYTSAAFLDTVLTAETLAERTKSMTIYVALDQRGEVAGTVACGLVDREEGHLRGMAVASAWQRAGVATRLLATAEAELRAKGCRRITLDTTAPLQPAMKFYEKNGYRRSGKVQDFFGMPLFEYVKAIQT